ncbi:unnamed protein product [Prunus armeniaca]|uniref:Uncharacterized protein n=1 Tax=Prunus armeniaca TaxID=36596 RepID=A0A6J5U2L2_PRUAR|nr:unnamed protein product [Prunus armeniaca]CAB4300271.1 unnamed protein product [Prunus armeniaca]
MAKDKFEISDDDIVIKHGAIPSVEFSERTAVIIKLKAPMSLIDMESNYFIVKFLLEEDKRFNAKEERVIITYPTNLVAEIPAKMHGQWMLMKPKNFRLKKSDKASGVMISTTQSRSRFNILRDDDGMDDEDDSFTPSPFSFKKASKLVA